MECLKIRALATDGVIHCKCGLFLEMMCSREELKPSCYSGLKEYPEKIMTLSVKSYSAIQ